VDLTGCEVAVSNITMYYSWDNINATTLQNNTFSYTWVSGATATTYQVVIPNGLYELADINAYLQFVFIQNGHYLVNSTSQNVYYAELIINPTQYAVQVNTFAVPTSLPAGFTNPAGLVFPTTTFNPVLTFPANFNEIVGYLPNFATDINTGGGNTLSYLSTEAPQLQPNSSLLIAMSGTYNQIRLQFLGNRLTPVVIRDANMTIILVIKDQDDLFSDIGASRSFGTGGLTHQAQLRSGSASSAGSITGTGYGRR
jgi:hypothetical protein